MTIDELHISAIFIALCGAAIFFAGAWIGPLRSKLNVLRGDGGDPVLHKRMRIHGNFVENVPIFAMVLAAAELAGIGDVWLWASIASFFVGRALHYVFYDNKLRGVGQGLTTAPALLLGLYVLASI